MKYLVLAFFALPFSATSQPPQVPHKLQFAGMTLTIRDDARREIQQDVDALTRSPKHFKIKVERARTYFPIIEQVFAEERLPDDFKYLVLQESALIPDAVSVSQAVGFWQFKDFTAVEMGLRVDRHVDERMNIVSSTRAAARYIKKNNFYFNNWLHALQAYQMGAGGAMKAIKDDKAGAKHMEITSRTYWYVKKYLAHKIAFADAVEGPGELMVATLPSSGHNSLGELAKAMSVTEDELLSYNKWLRRSAIPDDKDYAILVPVNDLTKDYLVTVHAATAGDAARAAGKSSASVQVATASVHKTSRTSINGVAAIAANPGEDAAAIADRAGISLSHFLRYNDIGINHKPAPGAYYFVGKKRARAGNAYHKVSEGENLWRISQQYGVQLKKILRFNRLKANSRPEPGTVLYLSGRKPKDGGPGIPARDVLEVDTNSLFAWSAGPESTSASGEPSTVNEPEEAGEMPATEASQPFAGKPDPKPGTGTATVETNTDTVVEEKAEDAVNKLPATTDEGINGLPAQHEVLAGETLYGIARQHNIAVMDIVRWNELDLNDGIKPGQILKLAGAKEETDAVPDGTLAEIVHDVEATDTLYSVARKYDVTIKELMEWNNKSDFTIHVGEKLKVLQR